MRTNFETERKAHRSMFYKSMIRNERSAVQPGDKVSRVNSDSLGMVNPKWNKELVGKLEVKKRLFHDHNHPSNYSVSVPQEYEDKFMAR